MASVRLSFIPPDEDNIVALKIYENDTAEGPFDLIETVTSIGSYPNYINDYTTQLAISATDWFQIAWEDEAGAVGEPSAPIKGGTESLTGIIVERMLLRDPTLNEIVAAQTAEAAISQYYGVMDPNSVDPSTVSPAVLEGLTLVSLVWAKTVTVSVASSTAQKFTAGLVSMDTGSSSTAKSSVNLDDLLKMANKLLGRGTSMILQLKEIPVSSGYTQLVSVDLSRTIIEVD